MVDCTISDVRHNVNHGLGGKGAKVGSGIWEKRMTGEDLKGGCRQLLDHHLQHTKRYTAIAPGGACADSRTPGGHTEL